MNKITDLYSIDGIDIDFVAKKITALNTDKKRIESEMNAINESSMEASRVCAPIILRPLRL